MTTKVIHEAQLAEVKELSQTSAEFVTAMVCIWRKELRYQITVTGVDFNRIKAGLYRKFHCLSVCVSHLLDLLDIHLLDECRGVEVETSASSVWHASADASM